MTHNRLLPVAWQSQNQTHQPYSLRCQPLLQRQASCLIQLLRLPARRWLQLFRLLSLLNQLIRASPSAD